MDSPYIAEDNWMSCDDSKYCTTKKEKQGSIHSRYSTCMNDDNYDYAIELKLDDEYRQAADALPGISELDILDDDDLLVLLDKHTSFQSRRVTLSAAIEHGKVKEFIRQSLSSISPNRRIGEDSIVNEVPSPLQGSPANNRDIENGMDSRNDIDGNEVEIPPIIPHHQSPLQPLSARRMTPIRIPGSSPENPEKSDLSRNHDKGWSLTAVWNATVQSVRPVSQRIMAAGAIIIGTESLNPMYLCMNIHMYI